MNQAEIAGMMDAFEKVSARTMIRRGGRKHVPMPDTEPVGREIAGKARHEVEQLRKRTDLPDHVMNAARERLSRLSHSLPEGKYHMHVKKRGTHIGTIVGNVVSKGKAIVKTMLEPHMTPYRGSRQVGHLKVGNLQNEVIGDYEICWSEMEQA